jgi:hypothetical protein
MVNVNGAKGLFDVEIGRSMDPIRWERKPRQ